MKKKQILSFISSILTFLAVLFMFCIAGGLDSDSLTIKSAVVLALLDVNLFGLAMVLTAKGQAYEIK